jgi:dihydrofolate synthase/folylpolyglutamate synthase
MVIGESTKETKPVYLAKAKSAKSKIYFADKVEERENLKTDLKGAYQRRNIATTLKVIEVLQELRVVITKSSIHKGLKHVIRNTSFMGRWMVIKKKPLIVFDSAHNEAGIREINAELRNSNFKKLHIVYGTVNDKDNSKLLTLLPKKAQYYFCKADIPRGKDAGELKMQASEIGLKGESYVSVKKAFKAANKNLKTGDMLLATGSIFIIAELL